MQKDLSMTLIGIDLMTLLSLIAYQYAKRGKLRVGTSNVYWRPLIFFTSLLVDENWWRMTFRLLLQIVTLAVIPVFVPWQ